MAEKFDWLVGDYFVYSYADVDTPIEECRASIFKKSSGRLGVHWHIQPGFEYTGQVTVAGGNVNVLSRRTNGEETVLSIFPKPNTEYVQLIWGVSAGASVSEETCRQYFESCTAGKNCRPLKHSGSLTLPASIIKPAS